MRKILVAFLGVSLCAPALVFADTASTQTQLQQLTTVLAELEAQIASIQSGQPLACAVVVSKSVVHANEPFILAWGSVGAINPDSNPGQGLWSQNGASRMTMDRPGTWSYPFTFYAQDGSSTKCAAKITVVR